MQLFTSTRSQGRGFFICSWCVRRMSASSWEWTMQSETTTSRQPPKWSPSPLGKRLSASMRTPRTPTRSQSRNHVLHPAGCRISTSSRRTSRQPTKNTQRPVMFVWLLRNQR